MRLLHLLPFPALEKCMESRIHLACRNERNSSDTSNDRNHRDFDFLCSRLAISPKSKEYIGHDRQDARHEFYFRKGNLYALQKISELPCPSQRAD